MENCALVIADLSEHNPNAFFEIGYRFALKKPIIHIKSKEYKIPFDIASIRTLDYDITDLDSVAEIKARLINTIQNLSLNDENTSTQKNPSENFSIQILNELYKIQDGIKNIESKLQHTDNSAVGILADKLASTQTQMTPEAALLSMLGEAMKNPESLKILMEHSDK